MSTKIRLLDETTINKIAAGEVVENPASVVKELVENAIDAGSTEIAVEIKSGGRLLIRITDDGCGMGRDDAVLALERHATSKIRTIDDLFTVGTMGFRGEAVPSIASISKFTLITNDNPESEGTMILIDGGKVQQVAGAARSQGTTIEVKNLFFNVPVRRKFQRSPTYDTNEILKVVTLEALAHPSIKFELISDGRQLLTMGRGQTLTERVKDILGAEFSRATTVIESEFDGIKIAGVIGFPTYTRQNRTGQYLFINKRPVVSSIVGYAVRDGYGTALPTTRHPVWVLQLTLPAELVDVNVHPQKREVRLRQQQELRQFIVSAVNKALGGQFDTEKVEVGVEAERAEISSVPRPFIRPAFSFDIPEQQEPLPFFPRQKAQEPKPMPLPLTPPKQTARVLATIQNYLVIDGETLSEKREGLCLVDQCAAHRRIIFESITREDKEIQQLLIPFTWELPTQEAAIVREHIEDFNHIGLSLHESGPHCFMIDAIPATLKSEDLHPILEDILNDLRRFQASDQFRKELEKQFAQAAGRATVSRRKKLSLYEAQGLVDQLMACKNPLQCPFGKPTFTQLSPDDLALQFRSAL